MRKSKLSEFIKHPHKSLILLSLPIIAASVVETLYNLVNEFFVGKLGADALAAITFAWPFFFMLMAIGLGMNSGVASLVSRLIGAKKKKEAENAAMHGLLFAFIVSIIVSALCAIFLKNILLFSGAENGVLDLSRSYIIMILIGAPFMFVSYVASSIFAAQGDTKSSMKIDAYSLIANILLAPVFIFWLSLGVAGAGLATTVSVVYACGLAYYYFHKHSYLRLTKKSFNFSWKFIKDIAFVGFPSTIGMLIMVFYATFINKAMVHYSIAHVASLGIVSTLESVSILPIYGLSIGAMTLAGMFYGAKKYHLLKSITWYSIGVSVVMSMAVGALFIIFAKPLISIFTNDPEVIAAGTSYLQLYVFTFPAMAVMLISGRIIQAMGKGLPGLIISMVRVFFIGLPLVYLFVFVLGYGYLSIAAAMIISGIATIIISIIWLAALFRKLGNKSTNN